MKKKRRTSAPIPPSSFTTTWVASPSTAPTPDLCEILVSRSLETLTWMRKKGVKFQASFGRQAMKIDGKFKFFGGLAAETWGGGPGSGRE